MSNSFTPLYQGTRQIAATNASANVALAKAAAAAIEITNEGPDTAYVEFGLSNAVAAAVGAATCGYPILAGQSKVIRNLDRNWSYAAAITDGAAKTAKVSFTCGDGE